MDQINEILQFFTKTKDIQYWLIGLWMSNSFIIFVLVIISSNSKRKYKTLKKDFKMLWDANEYLRTTNKQSLNKIEHIYKENNI